MFTLSEDLSFELLSEDKYTVIICNDVPVYVPIHLIRRVMPSIIYNGPGISPFAPPSLEVKNLKKE